MHDINGDKLLNGQEVRMMAISDLTESFKRANMSVESREFSEQLERLREEAEEADKDKDGFISKPEFFAAVDEANKEYVERMNTIRKESEFTKEEYNKFREERILEIRKMIANGILPTNYNYSDVPLLSGNFLNETHVMRNGVLVEVIPRLISPEQRAQDIKRSFTI